MTKSVMDVRRANLRVLIAQWGSASALAKKLKLSGPSYLSQMLGQGRPISEKSARKIEEALNLSRGWLDQEHDGKPKPAPVDSNLIVHVVTAVGSALDEAGVSLSNSRFADVVVLVYEEATRTGIVDEAFINRVIKIVR